MVYLDDLRAADGPRFDLVHRPFQLYNGEELALLRRIAGRLVVSHLDSIMYANPAYWVTAEEWREYRALTQLVFASAHGIAFISDDAIADAAHQGLSIPRERAANVYLGVDHSLGPEQGQPPGQAAAFEGLPFVLMIGTNYRHKNRVFAIRVVQELIAQLQWPGVLVFAGPEIAWGSSEQQEAEARLDGPELRDRVFYLGAVGVSARRWLLANAALALVPSLSEGFGFVAFEAAAAGTPALTSRLSAIAEVLGDQVAYFDTFDAHEGAQQAWRLLTDRAAAERQVAAINARAAEFTWRRHAERTCQFYERILHFPPRLHASAAPAGAAEIAAFIKARRALPALERTLASAGRPGAVREWHRRLSFGARVWREEGFQSLRREIRRYIRWRLAKL